MAELIVTLPNGHVRTHSLTRMPQEIGRDPTCHIQIDDATVSRRHADIRGEGDGTFLIRDLDSKNGTLLNDHLVRAQTLRHGDEIVFGSIRALFKEHDAPLARSTTAITVDEHETQVPQSISALGSAQELRLSQHRLKTLYEIADQLTALRDRADLLNDIMNICIATFDFERGAIGVRQGRGMDWPVVHNIRGADGEIRISRTILRQALEEGQRVILSDTSREMPDPTVSIVQQGTRSAMCVPMMYSDEVLGVIYGDRISTTRRYEQEDVDFLAALARQASIGLTNARLMEEQKEKIFLQKEIAIARQIQSDLFPETLDIDPRLSIAALNEPGRQVSGDYYDVLRMDNGCVGLVIADVVGKGVASALIAANLQAAVRLLLPAAEDLPALAGRLNQLVYQNTDTSRFITAILAVIDPQTRTLKLVNAGHHPPIVLSATRIDEVPHGESSLPFGIDEDTRYRCTTVALGVEPCSVFLYTDGLNEAMDEHENEYGLQRIFATLSEHRSRSPQALIQEVRNSVFGFSGRVPQRDDITLIAASI